jgi:SAM-dependent methyltransferase
MNTIRFDAAMSRRVESAYTTPDVVEQRRIVVGALSLQPGERVLDIGSGPGFLACEMASAVGASGSVTGIDPSEHMLSLAGERQAPAHVTFGPGNATDLPFAGGAFDVVTSTQVYEYVADMPRALAEAHRVLRPGGRLLVLDTDWDSIVWASSDDDRMRRVLSVWDEHLIDPHLPRRLAGLMADAGFEITGCRAIPLLNTSYSENSFSAGLIGFITAFVPGRGGVTPDESAAWADDLTGLGRGYFFSLNRYLFIASKQAL